jgi:hypothetical protein
LGAKQTLAAPSSAHTAHTAYARKIASFVSVQICCAFTAGIAGHRNAMHAHIAKVYFQTAQLRTALLYFGGIKRASL